MEGNSNSLSNSDCKIMIKTVFFTFMLLLLFSLSAYPQSVNWFDGTFEESLIKAKKDGKPILIEFFSASG